MSNEPDSAHNAGRTNLSDIGIEDRDLRIEVFAFCDGATEQAGRLSLAGTWEMLGVASIPFVLPQSCVVLRIRFWPAESRQQSIVLVMTGPDGEHVCPPAEYHAALQPIDGNRSTAYNLIATLPGMIIEKTGEYTIDLYLNDQLEARLPVCVYLNPAHGG